MNNYPELNKQDVIKMISQLIISGFNSETLDNQETLKKLLKNNLGGVFLKQKSTYSKKNQNIRDFKQVQNLIKSLQEHASIPLFISIDMYEDGRISPFPDNSDFNISSITPTKRGKQTIPTIRLEYKKIAKEISKLGINFLFDIPLGLHNTGKPYSYSADLTKVTNIITHISSSCHEINSSLTLCAKDYAHSSREAPLQVALLSSLSQKGAIPDCIQVSHGNSRQDKYGITNREIINDALKAALGYKGLVISSDYAVKDIFSPDDFKEFFSYGLLSGTDIFVTTYEHKVQLDDMLNVIKSLADDIIEEYDYHTGNILNAEDEKCKEIALEDYSKSMYILTKQAYNKVINYKKEKGLIL